MIYCTAFRRLQGKTQVFPLDDNAAIRTRLTHSLEVAHVGKYLASSVLELLDRQHKIEAFGLDGPYSMAFVAFVETACLLHDIGNPPFGHFGEVSIARWFSDFGAKNEISNKDINDLLKFDGNPQGFRIATRLSGRDPNTGLNLTFVQLASMLKYIGLPHHVDECQKLKKPGAFVTENEIFEKVCKTCNLNVGGKFPLAYLMEAADDISYCLSDIEDGCEKGLLSHDDAINGIVETCNDFPEASNFLKNAATKARKQIAIPKHIAFRSEIIRYLVGRASEDYVSNHEEILNGALLELIAEESTHGKMLNAIKDFARREIYNHKIPQSVELTGLAVVSGLLDCFSPLLIMDRQDIGALLTSSKHSKQFPVEFRLLRMLAARHVDVYKHLSKSDVSDDDEWRQRCHMVVDFISGMTDQFALSTFQRLSGIRL